MYTQEQATAALNELHSPDLDGWELFSSVDNFKVYRRPVANKALNEYKVLGSFPDVPPKYLCKTYTDLDYRKTWDKNMGSWTMLTDHKLHYTAKFPWPLSQRDYVYQMLVQEFDQGVICANGKSVAHEKAPPKSGTVRVDDYRQDIVMAPTEDGKGCKVWFGYYDDPKGNIPSSIVNWAAKSGIPAFLNSLRDASIKLLEKDLINEKAL